MSKQSYKIIVPGKNGDVIIYRTLKEGRTVSGLPVIKWMRAEWSVESLDSTGTFTLVSRDWAYAVDVVRKEKHLSPGIHTY